MNGNIFRIMNKHLKQKKSNNKGSSIILVIVSIAFVGMLVAMAVYMSYYNYLMKLNDRDAKENFYNAEEALAEINAGLQTVVSNSMAVAYSYALQNLTGSELSERQSEFGKTFREQVIKSVKGSDNKHYDIDLIDGYLKNTRYLPNEGYGAKLMIGQNENTIFIKEDDVILQNIKLMYTDKNGYVTILSTDIRLRVPDINLTDDVGVPELENCSLIANESLEVKGNNQIRISGNVYGGKEGVIATDDTKLLFSKKDDDVNVLYRLIAGGIRVENSYGTQGDTLSATKDYEIWTENIDVESGKIRLDGSVFVQDDLTITGRDSKVTLSGSYYGYGDEIYKSEGSSAILVNGANTTLDFSNLQSLMLSGHAYIGARHYDVNTSQADDYIENLDDETEKNETTDGTTDEVEEEDATTQPEEDKYKKNEKDLMMGESIGVKSNQLIYLVPTECMGYYNEAGREIGEQYLAKNPITYEEYLTLSQTYQYEIDETTGQVKKDENNEPVFKLDDEGNKIPKYKEVNLSVISKKLGKNLNAYGAMYKPVFRRINGTVLVYYYLDFSSDVAANEFFKDYYEADKENMDSYIKMYIKEFNMNSDLRVSQANLHLAGNLVKFDANNNAVLVEDTLMDDAYVIDTLAENRYEWADTYTAYSKKMIPTFSLLTSNQLMSDIFDNLVVNEATFTNFVPKGTYRVYESGNVKAMAINNKDDVQPFTINLANSQDVYVIIATGDVVIDGNYNGLIIAGGTISLAPNCNIVQSDAVKVRQAMMAKYNDNVFADLLLDGAAYKLGISTTAASGSVTTPEEQIELEVQKEEDYIDISELIVYENWTKQ